jgi:hypothetical protein
VRPRWRSPCPPPIVPRPWMLAVHHRHAQGDRAHLETRALRRRRGLDRRRDRAG